MFTVAAFAKEQQQHLSESFGFVTCECDNSFSFNFREKENTRRDGKRQLLVCPFCKKEGSEVVVPRYTDRKGVEHGRMKYKLVYTK